MINEFGLNAAPIEHNNQSVFNRPWHFFWFDIVQHVCCSYYYYGEKKDRCGCGWARLCCLHRKPHWRPVINTSAIRHNILKIILLIILCVYLIHRIPDDIKEVKSAVSTITTDVDTVSALVPEVSRDITHVLDTVGDVATTVDNELPTIENITHHVEATTENTAAFIDDTLPVLNSTINEVQEQVAVIMAIVVEMNDTLARLVPP